jgi:hypothetical protein
MAITVVLPDYRMMGIRFLPYSIVPMGLVMYEIVRTFKLDKENKDEEKEICHAAHWTAIVNGLIFGVLFRRIL